MKEKNGKFFSNLAKEKQPFAQKSLVVLLHF